MIKTETYFEKPRERIRVLELTCDDCGVKAENPSLSPDYTKWKDDRANFNFLECSVMITEGLKYPDSGSKTEYIYDICPDCLRKRMNGLIPREIESDW